MNKKSGVRNIILILITIIFISCGSKVVEDTTTELYIKSAIYDNNRTSTVSDDILSLYFSIPIDTNTITSNIGDSFDINGTGAIGSDSRGKYNTTTYEYKIFLGEASTAFNTDNNVSISLKANTITDINGAFPSKLNKTIVDKFFTIKKTGQTDSNVTKDDGEYQKGISISTQETVQIIL